MQLGNCEVMQQKQHNNCQEDLEAPLPLLNVLLWVENNHIDFGHVEHPKGDRGAQRHGDGQRSCLDKHLHKQRHAEKS